MEAMNIAGPTATIGQACANPMLPATVKTALRTLLLSTSEVPGTEGRKGKLRFDGHGNNLLFGGPSFFATPNFADTYNPLVKLLHDGPGEDTHLVAGRTDRAVASGGGCASNTGGDVERRKPPPPQLARPAAGWLWPRLWRPARPRCRSTASTSSQTWRGSTSRLQ